MSAIDFYMTVGGTVGKMGEKRVVITFNGKFACRSSSRSRPTATRRRRRSRVMLILVLHIPLHILTHTTTCASLFTADTAALSRAPIWGRHATIRQQNRQNRHRRRAERIDGTRGASRPSSSSLLRSSGATA